MFKKRDQQLLAEAYGQILNEGVFDMFKKKKPAPAPETPEAPEQEYRGRDITVSVFGKPQTFKEHSLMNNSETVETVPTSSGSGVYELNIYDWEVQDLGSYRDVPIFIPVVVLHDEGKGYPYPPSMLVAVGKQAYQSKEEAIRAGKELLQSATTKK
jgi:hypothetical protein